MQIGTGVGIKLNVVDAFIPLEGTAAAVRATRLCHVDGYCLPFLLRQIGQRQEPVVSLAQCVQLHSHSVATTQEIPKIDPRAGTHRWTRNDVEHDGLIYLSGVAHLAVKVTGK